jgi:hypothetical protein
MMSVEPVLLLGLPTYECRTCPLSPGQPTDECETCHQTATDECTMGAKIILATFSKLLR